MKKILLGIVAVFLSVGVAWGGTLQSGSRFVIRYGVDPDRVNADFNNFTILNGTTNATGIRFRMSSTSPIVSANFYEQMGEDLSGSYINISIWSRNLTTGNPETMLGTPTPQFACRATSGWSGEQSLGTDTGALVINDLYFAVIQQENGTLFNATRFLRGRFGNRVENIDSTARFKNDTTWGFINDLPTYAPIIVLKHADGSYSSMKAYSSKDTSSGNRDILGVNVQGIKFIPSCNVTAYGVAFDILKAGTANTLTFQIYNNITSEMSVDSLVNYIVSDVNQMYFDTPFVFKQNTTYYLLFNQTGTSDSNDYDLVGNYVNVSYYNYMKPDNWDMVYGNISNGTNSLVMETDFIPGVALCVENLSSITYTPGEGGEGTTVIRPSKSGFVK